MQRDIARAVSLRRATSADAKALTELAYRSKASWGYDLAFMERARPALSVSEQYIEDSPVYVLLREGIIAGFFGFIAQPGETILNDFWIEPSLIGSGLGRIMWQYAVEQAGALGYPAFVIHSDPNAEGFYLRMGARRAGTRIAPETGRSLPLLTYELGWAASGGQPA